MVRDYYHSLTLALAGLLLSGTLYDANVWRDSQWAYFEIMYLVGIVLVVLPFGDIRKHCRAKVAEQRMILLSSLLGTGALVLPYLAVYSGGRFECVAAAMSCSFLSSSVAGRWAKLCPDRALEMILSIGGVLVIVLDGEGMSSLLALAAGFCLSRSGGYVLKLKGASELPRGLEILRYVGIIAMLLPYRRLFGDNNAPLLQLLKSHYLDYTTVPRLVLAVLSILMSVVATAYGSLNADFHSSVLFFVPLAAVAAFVVLRDPDVTPPSTIAAVLLAFGSYVAAAIEAVAAQLGEEVAAEQAEQRALERAGQDSETTKPVLGKRKSDEIGEAAATTPVASGQNVEETAAITSRASGSTETTRQAPPCQNFQRGFCPFFKCEFSHAVQGKLNDDYRYAGLGDQAKKLGINITDEALQEIRNFSRQQIQKLLKETADECKDAALNKKKKLDANAMLLDKAGKLKGKRRRKT